MNQRNNYQSTRAEAEELQSGFFRQVNKTWQHERRQSEAGEDWRKEYRIYYASLL